MKIAEIRLLDSLKNQMTLIVGFKDGWYKYRLRSGWGALGTPYALSALQIGYKFGSHLPSCQGDIETFAKRPIQHTDVVNIIGDTLHHDSVYFVTDIKTTIS